MPLMGKNGWRLCAYPGRTSDFTESPCHIHKWFLVAFPPQNYEGSPATAVANGVPYGALREMFAGGTFLQLQLLLDYNDPDPLPDAAPASGEGPEADEDGAEGEQGHGGAPAPAPELRHGSFSIVLHPAAEDIQEVVVGLFDDMVRDLSQVARAGTPVADEQRIFY